MGSTRTKSPAFKEMYLSLGVAAINISLVVGLADLALFVHSFLINNLFWFVLLAAFTLLLARRAWNRERTSREQAISLSRSLKRRGWLKSFDRKSKRTLGR